MKTKEELLRKYREMAEDQATQKDVVLLEVLVDIRDALAALENRSRTARGWSDFFSP
jgi:hypothetical protein